MESGTDDFSWQNPTDAIIGNDPAPPAQEQAAPAPTENPLAEFEHLFAPKPENFRTISQIYTDQLSIIRRTSNAVRAAVETTADAANDPLSSLVTDKNILETQSFIVDLIIMAAFGQMIRVEEYQEYAKRLVSYYSTFDFVARYQQSAIRNNELDELLAEWNQGNNLTRVQQFYRYANASITNASTYCNVPIATLPEF